MGLCPQKTLPLAEEGRGEKYKALPIRSLIEGRDHSPGLVHRHRALQRQADFRGAALPTAEPGTGRRGSHQRHCLAGQEVGDTGSPAGDLARREGTGVLHHARSHTGFADHQSGGAGGGGEPGDDAAGLAEDHGALPGVGRQRGAAGPATKGRADRWGGGEGDFGIQRVELFGLAAGQSAGDVGAGDCARASAGLGDGQGVVVEGEGRGAGQIIGWHDEAGSARAGIPTNEG